MSYLIYYVLIFTVELSEFGEKEAVFISHTYLEMGIYEHALVDMDRHSSPTLQRTGSEAPCSGLIWLYT